MIKYNIISALTVLIILIGSCTENNNLPTCKISYPDNGSEFEVGDTIIISVNADDVDGFITEVRYYIEEIGIASSHDFPYTYEWNTTGEEKGIKRIKVRAKDDQGAINEQEISIMLYPEGDPPIVAFEADKTLIYKGDTIQFSDYSTNNPTSWKWDFGDGDSSNIQNPKHTYDTVGVFNVSLKSSNWYGFDIETRNEYITVRSKSENIPYVKVDLQLNIISELGNPALNSYLLYEGGNKGLIIYRENFNIFHVYDRTCTQYPDHNVAVDLDEEFDGVFTCPICKSRYLLLTGADPIEGPASIGLHEYFSSVEGSILNIYN